MTPILVHARSKSFEERRLPANSCSAHAKKVPQYAPHTPPYRGTVAYNKLFSNSDRNRFDLERTWRMKEEKRTARKNEFWFPASGRQAHKHLPDRPRLHYMYSAMERAMSCLDVFGIIHGQYMEELAFAEPRFRNRSHDEPQSKRRNGIFAVSLVSPLMVPYIYLICCDAKENSREFAIKRIGHCAAIIYDSFSLDERKGTKNRKSRHYRSTSSLGAQICCVSVIHTYRLFRHDSCI